RAGRPGGPALRGSAPHLVGDVAQLPRGLRELLVTRLARERLELAGHLLRLLGERALVVGAPAAALRLQATPLGGLLLPAGQLLELLQHLVHLVRLRLAG